MISNSSLYLSHNILVSNVENSKVFEVAERVLTADGKGALFQKVQDLCNQLHRLLKEANMQNNTGVVEACFQCWFDMHRFGGMAAFVWSKFLLCK